MIILLVEDHDDTREMITMMLKINGYSVVEAIDGLEAIDLALEKNPDVILMDLNLPIITGWEATRTLKRIPQMQDVPIIAISAQCQDETKEAALDAGAVECVMKPLDHKELKEMIDKYKKQKAAPK